MESDAVDADGGAALVDPEEHHPHVLPVGAYLAVFVALLALTAVTVGVSYLSFGPWNLVIALVVATLKAACVAAVFMHLAFDSKFNTVALLTALIFLAIFIGFTWLDLFERGRTDPIEATAPVQVSTPFDPKAGVKPVIPKSGH